MLTSYPLLHILKGLDQNSGKIRRPACGSYLIPRDWDKDKILLSL